MMSGLMQQVAVDSACHVGVFTLVAVAEVGAPPAINQVVEGHQRFLHFMYSRS